MRWLATIPLVLTLLVGACGENEPTPDAPTETRAPMLVVDEALDAIRDRHGARLLDLVAAPADAPHGPNDARGVEETLVRLGGVEFDRVDAEQEVGAVDRVFVVPIVLHDPAREESRVVAGLTLGLENGVWRITARSLRDLLLQALEVATGIGERERRTRLMLDVIAGSVARYAQDHEGTLPSVLKDLVSLDPHGERYVSAIPRDGWNRPLEYRRRGDGTFELRSAGADGIVETDDDLSPP